MKKVISAILGVFFVIFVVIGIVVATYVFSSPSKDGESRQLIMGNWIDTDNHVKFTCFSTATVPKTSTSV